MERKRLVSIERDGLSDMVASVNLMNVAADRLANRIRIIKGGSRNLGLFRWVAEKLLSDILRTAPNEQLLALKKNLPNVSYRVGVRLPAASGTQDGYGLWLSNTDISALSDASREKCLTCDLHGRAEQECPLRRALDNLGSETEHEINGCEYRWM